MHDAAAGRRMLQVRNPRHVGFEHDHQIGVGEQRPGSKPKCMGWLDGRQTVRGFCVITGMAQRSASFDSGRTALAGSAPAMISGRSAAAIHSASVAIAADRDARRRPAGAA